MGEGGTTSMAEGNMQEAAKLALLRSSPLQGLAQANTAPAIAVASLAPGPGRQPAMQP